MSSKTKHLKTCEYKGVDTRIKGQCFYDTDKKRDEDVNTLLGTVAFKFVCFEFEVGDEKEGKHIQWYVHCKRKTCLCFLDKMFGRKVAHEYCGKDYRDINGMAYCQKDRNGTYQMKGDPEKDKGTNQWLDITNLVKGGKDEKWFVENGYSMNQIQYALKVMQHFCPEQPALEERVFIDAIWVYGESDTGKTDFVLDMCPIKPYRKAGWTGEDMDGYLGESRVWFEELEPKKNFDANLFKTLFDGLPVRLRARYTNGVIWRAEHVYVTSKYSPEKFAEECGCQHREFTKRFKRVINLNLKRYTGVKRKREVTPDPLPPLSLQV